MSPPEIWGPAVWCLFHTFAEKINEHAFPFVFPSLFNIIVKICKFLPCPECSKDASNYLAKLKLSNITNKTDFRNTFYIFHNWVNAKKRKMLFHYSQIYIYGRYNLIQVVNNFISKYKTKGNMKLLTDTFQRQFVIKNFKEWFQKYIKAFVTVVNIPHPVSNNQFTERVKEQSETPETSSETTMGTAKTSSETSTETLSEMSAETSSEMPAKTSSEMPAKTSSETSTETLSEIPAETLSEMPAETLSEMQTGTTETTTGTAETTSETPTGTSETIKKHFESVEEVNLAVEEVNLAVEEANLKVEEAKLTVEEAILTVEEAILTVEDTNLAVEKAILTTDEEFETMESPIENIKEPILAIDETKLNVE